jgi:hypothetical protein
MPHFQKGGVRIRYVPCDRSNSAAASSQAKRRTRGRAEQRRIDDGCGDRACTHDANTGYRPGGANSREVLNGARSPTGKVRLGRTSKRGDKFIRSLLFSAKLALRPGPDVIIWKTLCALLVARLALTSSIWAAGQ